MQTIQEGKTRRYYADEGVNGNDWWSDIWSLPPTSSERIDYPTQKPIALLERIIKSSSSKGDLVLDPFAGSCTTCIAAEMLGRQWIGLDLWEGTVDIVNKRMADCGIDERIETINGDRI